MDPKHLSVLIIGCGNIAGGFDVGLPKNHFPCTHAGGYSRDGRFSLFACVDPDPQARHAFMSHWGVARGFSNIEEMLSESLSIDIVSICSPTKYHKSHILSALNLQPKLIFCEKPITPSCRESAEVIKACESANVLLCINHNRRWDPEINALKQNVPQGVNGTLRSVVGFYNKGALNNGSHMIDLLRYLLGELSIIATATPTSDYSGEDPTVPALLQSEEGIPVHLVTSNAKDFSLFELQFIFSDGIVTMQDGGQSWELRSIIDSERFQGYKTLTPGLHRKGGYEHTTMAAIENIYTAINSGSKLLSDGKSAYHAQMICEQLIGRKSNQQVK